MLKEWGKTERYGGQEAFCSILIWFFEKTLTNDGLTAEYYLAGSHAKLKRMPKLKNKMPMGLDVMLENQLGHW